MASFRGALSPSFCRIIARRGARVKPQNAFFALKTIAGQWGKRPSAYSPPLFPFLRTRHARPGSFFRSGNHRPALLRSPVLSRLGNSSAQQSSVRRTTVFDGLRPRAPRPKPSTRLASSTRILFPPPEPHQFDLSVRPPPLPWGNSPPDDSLSDGHDRLLSFQTPAPVTRVTRPMGGRANGRRREHIHHPPRMCARVCARARLYEKENYSKITCCRPP